MKKVIISAAAVALATVGMSSAQAENSSKEEMAGVGGGAIIGGAVGGPPGIVIGAAIGALLGDKFHQKGESIERLTDVVAERDAEVVRLESDLGEQQTTTTALRESLAEIDRSGVRALYNAMDTGISFAVPFRTDQDVPELDLVAQVNAVAATLADMPQLGVQIDGFADARGAVDYNSDLSLRRATAIRELLIETGVDPERIQTFGHGALSHYDTTDPDALALQRRVVVTFYRDNAESGELAAANTPITD